MSGIYIHVPFCYQRCHYCDFYSTISLDKRKLFTERLIEEISERKSFLEGEEIDSIYFGGGTPSVLKAESIDLIIKSIKSTFSLKDDVEVTLEANPDDLDRKYLKELTGTCVNRLSIGIQSFNNDDLKRLNRRHDSEQAADAVIVASSYGYSNISIDLIYGLPDQNPDKWESILNQAINLPVNHISAYHLTYEKGTNFYKWLIEGRLRETKEEISLDLFRLAVKILENNGFEHYEISNYAKNKQYSRHNTKYWFGEKYLGVGPSAHSYDGKNRFWNVSDLEKWLIQKEEIEKSQEYEIVDRTTKRNEMIMTRLRTIWGISSHDFIKQFGQEEWVMLYNMAERFLKNDLMVFDKQSLMITRKGKFLSDGIIADLFIV